MTKKTLVITIPIVAVILNGVGYLIYKNTRPQPSDGTSDVTRGRSGLPAALPGQGPPLEAAPAKEGAKEGVGEGQAGVAETARERQAQSRRTAGLAALEAGEYDMALINFTEAKALIGDKANVADLLEVTQELRRKPATTRTRPVVEGTLRRNQPRGAPRRVAVREIAEEEPAPSAAAGGLLIVSTTPRGILVHVDDTPVDLTPMKTKVKAGVHRISLFDGDHQVFETSVQVKEGGTATLVHDLSARVSEPPSPPPPVVPAAVKDDALRPTPVAAQPAAPLPPPAPVLAATLPAAAAAVTTGDRGALDISVPGLYGVVWVNGRPRGYPPLAVPDLPAGPAQVEVRVNGVQKRSATAMVRPGLTTSVRLRSQASP